jgi:PAS domain S-box-containing protein
MCRGAAKMSEKINVADDPRVLKILDFIEKLAAGDLRKRETPTGKNDEVDGIIMGLNMLADELSYRVVSLSEAEKRLDEIMDVILAIASLDYSRKIPVSNKGDTFDAIASGLNALSEELHASTVSKDYLDNIIQSMSDILLVLTPDEKIQKVNPAAVQILGYQEEELIGRHLAVVFEGKTFKELGFSDSIKKKAIKSRETACQTKDGCKIPISFSSSVMSNEKGIVEGIVCVGHGISEQKLLEQERLMRQQRLAQLGQLASGIGHELRNPLGAIKNSVYFLNMVIQDKDPEIMETLDILEKEVTASERIITSLLEFARARPPLKRKTKINDIISEALSRLDTPDNIEVKNEIAAALPFIMADPHQLGHIFGNILLNAVQAMNGGGKLVIGSGTSEPGRLVISISDTGVGIPPENLSKIFTPLFTSKAKGIGLGMAITKTFVEGHGGSIEVQSKSGEGSTFSVKLPILIEEGSNNGTER